MTVTSTTQTQYTSQAQSKSSSVQETPKNDQQSRYEMLLKKGDSMSEAEWKELHHYNAMRPVKYLDEAGNAALEKALEGKTDTEKFQIKGILELEFMTSVKLNAQGGLDRKKFDSIDTSKSATEDRFSNYLETYDDLHPLDTLGIKNVVAKFLDIYKNDSTKDVKNQENSVVDKFLEDLYSKGSTATASAITKESIQNKVNEYAQVLMESRGDTPKSESDISKMLNDYKKELLSDYKKSLDSATNDTMTLEQQGIIKVLLEENTQEASSLEKLLATTEVNKTQRVTVTGATLANESTASTEVDTSEYDFWKDPTKGLSFLDDKANTLLNNLLSGKTDEEIFLTKVTMMINIANPVTTDKEGNVIRGNNSSFDISSDAVKTRLKDYQNYLEDALKGGVDTLNLLDISKQLFELYAKSDTTTEDLK